MRVLLDECLPRQLGYHLKGHDVRTVTQSGWSGIDNGDLLGRAAGVFDVFVTIDQELEWEQHVPAALALITLKAPTNRLESLLPLVQRILESLNTINPGECVRLDTGSP